MPPAKLLKALGEEGAGTAKWYTSVLQGVAVIILAALLLGAWDFVVTTKTFMAVTVQRLEQIDKSLGDIRADLKGAK